MPVIKKSLFFLSMIAVLFLASCGTSASGVEDQYFSVTAELPIPEGYEFAGASAYGRFSNNLTIYCREEVSGKVYTCEGGIIGAEIILPDGYSFVGASAYGRFSNNLTIYCMQDATGRIFLCE